MEGVVVRLAEAVAEHAAVGRGVSGAPVAGVADGTARAGSQHPVAVLHPGELEARWRPCAGRQEPAYNAPAGVDAKAGIIVAETAVNAESDNPLLVPMREETRSNLGAVAEETGAHGGYSSAAPLEAAEARG